MTPKKVFHQWTMIPEDEVVVGVMRTGLLEGEIIEPIATAADEHEEYFVALKVTKVLVVTPIGPADIPLLRILVPGLCGHFGCGGMVEVCLN